MHRPGNALKNYWLKPNTIETLLSLIYIAPIPLPFALAFGFIDILELIIGYRKN
jgi:hypothetical protein